MNGWHGIGRGWRRGLLERKPGVAATATTPGVSRVTDQAVQLVL